ncbi:MAG: hypothetical protein Kow0059_03250 [Candidatus Sumerlaeia bacterium]
MKVWKVLSAAVLVGLVFTVSTPSIQASDVYREQTAIDAMMEKLGRGMVNILTGWVEIPKNIAKKWRETDPFTGFVVGSIKGVGWGFARTMVGVYETITFPFPVPRDYQPIMEPEYILPSVWGEELPFMEGEAKDANLELY